MNRLICRGCGSDNLKTYKAGDILWGLCRNCLFNGKQEIKNEKIEMQINESYEWGKNINKISFEKHVLNKNARLKFIQSFRKSITGVLDVGSGFGPLLEACKRSAIYAVGLEPSIKNSEYSKSLGHNVLNNYAEDIELRAIMQDVDIINFENCTYYFQELAIFFNNIRGCMREDALIFWCEKDYLLSPLNIFNNLSNTLQLQYLSKSSIRNLLERCGFKVIYYKRRCGVFNLVAMPGNIKKEKINRYKFKFHYLYLKNINQIDAVFLIFYSAYTKIIRLVKKWKN
jgi:hypothetical protein